MTGDSGFAVGGSTRLPEFHQCDDPDVVAKFAKYADASLFLQECDAPRQLDRLEAAFVRWSERGMADTMFWGQSFQELTMRRVLSASRGSNELSEDIVRILDEADFSVLSMLAGKAPDPATFYSDVLVALRAGDRPTVVGLLLENRRQTLVALGVPDSEVPSIDVPEAKVQW
ncbi:hypothetical protein nbrc107696_19490 [Gordonia spumicola]|uniref:Uncharacterized protein n=1 Tax=Gordonia spumicola TaxID=589161 RepID=A0A7I9V8S8_9ACTN|nr:hypothetical protein [Gordonia spumicola]GEE01503.1 hypothetical protein nbrc107696_19490 [Gordonia spumicola]